MALCRSDRSNWPAKAPIITVAVKVMLLRVQV